MNVNVSPEQIGCGTFVDDDAGALEQAGVDAQDVCIELTESVFMKGSDAIAATLRRLRGLGVGLALDDFGTGYSGLVYLRWMRVDTLKLGRSFVVPLGTDPQSATIVRSVIALATRLGLTVVGEGIEAEKHHAELEGCACDRGQGYYFSYPLAADAVTERIRREHAPGPGLRAARPAADAPPSDAEDDARSILVIDDDAVIRDLIGLVLSEEGNTVHRAPHGAAALEPIKARQPEAILLNMMMPRMDGRPFSQAYHALPGPHAPIIVVTAAMHADQRAAEVGANGYLAQSFGVGEMLSTVREVLDGQYM